MQLIRISILAFLLILSANISSSQTLDYLDIRDSILIQTCGGKDTTTVHNSLSNLESLDVSLLRKNIHQYYQDLGARYWLLSGSRENAGYMDLAIDAYRKAFTHNPKSSTALYSLSFISFVKLDCNQGKYYMGLYKKATPKRYFNPELEKLSQTNCL